MVTVNDEMISSFDVVQRMRLLIVTSGIQPSPENLPDIQREAVRSLIDERLEMQELRREAKEQKFDLIASDAEVNDELADIARGNNTSSDQLLAQLAAQGVGAQTFRDQLRAEISWRGWIRGRYGQRLVIGDDQVKAFQKHLEAEADKPQYQISEIFVDAARAGGVAGRRARGVAIAQPASERRAFRRRGQTVLQHAVGGQWRRRRLDFSRRDAPAG